MGISPVPYIDYAGNSANATLTNAQVPQVQAQAQLTQAQAQSAQMQNQVQAAQLPLILKAFNDYNNASNDSGITDSSAAPPAVKGPAAAAAQGDQSGVPDPDTNWFNPAATDQALRSKYTVPLYTPQEQKLMVPAMMAARAGNTTLLDTLQKQRQMRIDTQTQMNQVDSSNHYDTMATVVNADPGMAMAQLAAVAPDTVTKIKAAFANDPNEERDEDNAARQFAGNFASTLHMYTGRAADARGDGTYVDSVSKQPVAGVQKNQLSTEQIAKIANDGMQQTTRPDGNGHTATKFNYQWAGFGDNKSYIASQMQLAGAPALQPGVGGAPRAQAQAAIAQADAAAQKAVPPAAKAMPVTVKTGNGQVDPAATAAANDTSFAATLPKTPANSTRSPDEQAAYDDWQKNTNATKVEIAGGVKAAQSSKALYAAAQDILNTKGAAVGKYGKMIAAVGQYFPRGSAANAASMDYKELAKVLANAALSSSGSYFGKMTEGQSEEALHTLNPSPDMPEDAIRNMVQRGLNTAQYAIDTGTHAGLFFGAKTKNEPTSFYNWNEKHWPMDKAINVGTDPNADKPQSTSKPMPTGAKLSTYAATHFGGNTAKATAYLQSQGYK